MLTAENLQEHTAALMANTKMLERFCEVLQRRDFADRNINTKEALLILGLTNERDLKYLRDRGHIAKFWKNGKLFKYDRNELFDVAAKLQSNKITIIRK